MTSNPVEPTQPAGARALAGNTALLAAAQTIGTAARLVYVVAVARLLGPELYALLAWAQSWHLAFLPLALAGLGPALVQLLAAAPDRLAALAAASLALRLALTVAAAALCLAGVAIAAPDPRAPLLVAILLIAFAGRALVAWAQHLYLVTGLNRLTLLQEALFRVAEVAVALGVLAGGGGLTGIVLVHAVAWCVQAGLAWRSVARHIGPPVLAWRGTDIRPLLAVALPFLILQTLAEWRIHGPLVLFGQMAPPAAFAPFALAMQAMLLLTIVPQSLGAAAQAGLVRAAGRNDGRDLLYATTLQRFAVVAGTAVGLTGLALAPPVVTALFGAPYAAAGELAGLALWCLIPVTAGFGLPLTLVTRGELRGQIFVSGVATLLMMVAVPWLGSRYGAPGAIAAAALGFTLPPLWATVLAVQRGWASWSELLLRPIGTAAAALAVYRLLEPQGALPALAGSLLVLAAVAWSLRVVHHGDLRLLRAG